MKKYSPIGEISAIAKDYTDSLHRTLGHIALISDRDAIVASSGAGKRDYAGKTAECGCRANSAKTGRRWS